MGVDLALDPRLLGAPLAGFAVEELAIDQPDRLAYPGTSHRSAPECAGALAGA